MINIYSAKYDIIFQQAMCLEENKDILKWFLEKLLDKEIEKIKILTPIMPINNVHERKKTVDVLVETKEEIINIEVNNGYYKSLNRRNFGYLGAAYNSSMKKGKNPLTMPSFIQINLTWSLPSKYKDIPVLCYKVYDEKNKDEFIDNIKILVYNMDSIRNLYYNKVTKEVKKDAPKHLLMLDLTGDELKKICKGDKVMEKFEENVDKLNKDEFVVNFLTAEEEDEMLRNTYKSEGEEIGFERGIKLGIKQGKADGIKLGVNQEKIEIAKNLIAAGIEEEVILKTTGITKEALNELKSGEN